MSNDLSIADLTLLLLYKTSWKEKVGTMGEVARSWRSYDWDALDALRDDELICGNRKAKSVYLTDDGLKKAEELEARIFLDKTTPAAKTKKDVSKTKKQSSARKAFKFRIELDFYELSCWREVIVPADYSFLDFHIVIQNTFNWLDYHLYDFVLTQKGNKIRISDPDPEGVDMIWSGLFGEPKLEEVDARELKLSDVFPKTRSALYSYDYGDGWEHKIKLLETLADYANNEPLCVDGFGDAPPEDVGAEGGFADFLEAIGDEEHPEHAEMVEWGESQNFRRFDIADVNETLAMWRDYKELREFYR